MQIDYEDAQTGDEILLQPDVTYEIVQTLICQDAEEGLVTTHRVRAWTREASNQRRMTLDERRGRDEMIRAAYEQGSTQEQLARRFGLTQSWVGQIVRAGRQHSETP